METLGDKENSNINKELQKFLTKMTNPIIKKERKEIKKKYFDKAPHPAIHNHHTIKWLRQRVNGNTIEKGVKSLLPNNGECMIEEDTSSQKYKLKKFLKEYYKKEDKFRNIEITPKYFFSELIMNKIKKLRDIFLEFDEDGSRKLEIDEMVIMFKTNNIKVVQEDLKTLFFKDDKKLQDDELFLDFYQFMEFALNKECDQDFRLFMRKLKNKRNSVTERKSVFTDEYKSSGIISKDLNYDATNSFLNTKSEEEDALFLPMNFNLLLDYFNNKGKQRVSMSKIQEAIEIMTKIIDGGIDNLHSKEKETINHHEDDKSIISNEFHNDEHLNENERELKKKKQVEETFRLHDALDCRILLEEFRKLFAQKPTADYEDNATAIIEKMFQIGNSKTNKKCTEGEENKGKKNIFASLDDKKKKQLADLFTNFKSKNINKTSSTDQNQNTKNSVQENNFLESDLQKDDMVFTKYIKNKLESKDPNQICMTQYKKYKSLLLAFEETKNCLNNYESSVISGNTGHKTRSTGFSVPQKKKCLNSNISNNDNSDNINHFDQKQFQFRADFYNNTTKEWNKNGKNIENLKDNNFKGFSNHCWNTKANYNVSPGKSSKINNNYINYMNNYITTKNHLNKKVKLPDPQYNFNYQAKYFGVEDNLDKNKKQKYENFLLPFLNKKEKSSNDKDFVPKTLLMELKQRNEIN